MEGLPGEELVRQGLKDLAASQQTVPGLLVMIGYPRLRLLGVSTETTPCHTEQPELRLYPFLLKQYPSDAYQQYNALIRRLVSFERTLERRQQTHRRQQYEL